MRRIGVKQRIFRTPPSAGRSGDPANQQALQGGMMKKPFLVFPACFLGGLLCLGGCVNQNQINAMQARLAQQEQQIQQLHSQLSGVQPAQADTWAQVQSLRQEMGAVRGQIDDFNNATAPAGGLAGLAQRVARHDEALRSLQTQFALDLQLDQPVAGGMGTGYNQPLTGQTPGASGGLPQQTGVSSAVPAGSPAVDQSVAAAPQQQTQQGQKDTATALYDAGIASFNARKYQDAFNAFRDFTDTYPKHRLVSNAWFWRGESNFQLNNFPAAALDYEQVISKYPSSGKAASAYLKQGMSFIKTNKKDAAKFRLDELIKKFPKSPEAARAKQLLTTL